MKKRTVITTEKRELWIISGGGVVRETPNRPPSNASTDSSEALTPGAQVDSEKTLENKVGSDGLPAAIV